MEGPALLQHQTRAAQLGESSFDMFTKVVLCALVGIAVAQRGPADDGDDGSYHPEKYEVPYLNEVSSPPQQQQQQYRAQPQQYQQPQAQQYQPQPQYQPQQQYQPQPQYRAPQPSYDRPVTDSRNAAILSEARYLSADGKFGAQYSQEDGVEFKEESDPDGTRRGSYSYVDPSGQRRTISYTAGKDGFQATGDHLPVAPVPAGAAPAPQPQYQAQPQYRAPQTQQQYRAPQAQPQEQYRAPQAQSQYRVSEPEYQAPQSQYRAPQQQSRYSAPQEPASPFSPGGGYTITSNY